MAAKKATKKTVSPKKPVAKGKKEAVVAWLSDNKFMVIAALMLLFAAVYYFKGAFVAAMVNGRPISRLRVIRELERQGGSEAMDTIITKTLIYQEAESRNLSVSEEEMQAEIAEFEKVLSDQGQDLNSALAFQGMSMDDFREQVRLQLLIEKMFSEEAQVSDEEIAAYIEENKDLLPEDQNEEDTKKQVSDQLKQQKVGSSFQNWLSEKRESSDIKYYVNYAK